MSEILVTNTSDSVELNKITNELYSFPKLFKSNNIINAMLLRDNTIFTNSELVNNIHRIINDKIKLHRKNCVISNNGLGYNCIWDSGKIKWSKCV